MGGLFGLDDFDFTSTGGRANPVTTNTIAEFDEGWLAGVATGRRWGRNARTEFEFLYRNNQPDSFMVTETQNNVVINQSQLTADGIFEAYTGTVNVLVDFRRICLRRWTPYAGGGIGYGWFEGDFQLQNGDQFFVSDENWVYQVITGASRSLSPYSEFFAEFRYTGSDRLSLNDAGGAQVGEFNYQSSNFIFGLRITR